MGIDGSQRNNRDTSTIEVVQSAEFEGVNWKSKVQEDQLKYVLYKSANLNKLSTQYVTRMNTVTNDLKAHH